MGSDLIRMAPSGTATAPFEFSAGQDHDQVHFGLRHATDQATGTVRYRVKLTPPTVVSTAESR